MQRFIQTVYFWNLNWPFEPWELSGNVVLEVYTAGRLPQLPALDRCCSRTVFCLLLRRNHKDLKQWVKKKWLSLVKFWTHKCDLYNMHGRRAVKLNSTWSHWCRLKSEHENKKDLLDTKGNTTHWYPKQLCAEGEKMNTRYIVYTQYGILRLDFLIFTASKGQLSDCSVPLCVGAMTSFHYEKLPQDCIHRLLCPNWPVVSLLSDGSHYMFRTVSQPSPLASSHQGRSYHLNRFWCLNVTLFAYFKKEPVNDRGEIIDNHVI